LDKSLYTLRLKLGGVFHPFCDNNNSSLSLVKSEGELEEEYEEGADIVGDDGVLEVEEEI